MIGIAEASAGGSPSLEGRGANFGMTIAESKAELRSPDGGGATTGVQVTEAGVLVYVFPGFLSDEDKARATDF